MTGFKIHKELIRERSNDQRLAFQEKEKMTSTATTLRGIMITDFTTLYGMVLGD
jgi:hypothetical protein